MDIFFQDPTEVPLPPGDVRIRDFQAVPWPDGRRVKIYLEVEPFQKRPSADIVIFTQEGSLAAEVSVIESMTRQMEFNLHLRQTSPARKYQVRAVIYYEQLPTLPPAGQTEPLPPPPVGQPEIVDRREIFFEVPEQN